MQTKPDYLDQLIDRASAAAGSDYKLAQQIGVNRQAISNWRHGHKTCPAADQALMAQIAGLDPEAWASRALIAAYEGEPKGELLKQALKKALLATGAALAMSGGAQAADQGQPLHVVDTMYRLLTKRVRSRMVDMWRIRYGKRRANGNHGGAHPHTPESGLTLVASRIQQNCLVWQ